jgi:hypothetical protein
MEDGSVGLPTDCTIRNSPEKTARDTSDPDNESIPGAAALISVDLFSLSISPPSSLSDAVEEEAGPRETAITQEKWD